MSLTSILYADLHHRYATFQYYSILMYKNFKYLLVVTNPSCLQTTLASLSSHPSSHTVPHSLLIQISTLPSKGLKPPDNLTSPYEQLAVTRYIYVLFIYIYIYI